MREKEKRRLTKGMKNKEEEKGNRNKRWEEKGREERGQDINIYSECV